MRVRERPDAPEELHFLSWLTELFDATETVAFRTGGN